MKFICLLLLASCSPMLYTHGVPNLVRVDERVYRGGQPTPEGWQYLRSLGVKTVIKLNAEEEGTDAPIDASVKRWPLDPRDGHPEDIFTQPSREYLMAIVRSIDDSTGKVYVHCSHGQDRTGLVIAIYRVIHGWPKAQAQDEMHALHFHWELPGLSWAWREFAL